MHCSKISGDITNTHNIQCKHKLNSSFFLHVLLSFYKHTTKKLTGIVVVQTIKYVIN